MVAESVLEETKYDIAEKYLTATAGGLTSIIIGLAAKARGAMFAGLARRAGGKAIAFIKRNKQG